MTFDAAAWTEKCAAAAHRAAAGTGLSDVAWSKNLHYALAPHLAKIAPEHYDEARAIAHKWGYEELAEIAKAGGCTHGFDPHCCPVGCGARD